jgi:hypothetical protein
MSSKMSFNLICVYFIHKPLSKYKTTECTFLLHFLFMVYRKQQFFVARLFTNTDNKEEICEKVKLQYGACNLKRY